jgi:UDP-N-acetylglucosamine--N-acetylmuramyl-(pentapeptide) pyrophosphoryl-undecaprenol N-acetylglucosamine transferase
MAHIILTAGGTGGHIFPALALGQALIAQGHQCTLLTDYRFAEHYKKEAGAIHIFPMHCLNIRKTPLKGIISLLQSIYYAYQFLKKTKPQLLVGFGGYPSLPPLLAAIGCQIPILIHEQNSVLGRVNRWLAPYVQSLALSFPNTQQLPSPKSHQYHALFGNPVRQSIEVLANNYHYQPPALDEPFHLLIIGGSQGAEFFSDLIPSALALLPSRYQQRLHVTIQCRENRSEQTEQQLAQLNLNNYSVAPFFDDMPNKLRHAHWTIARAGASSISELTLLGIPSLLVPLPHSADNHQWHNAFYVQQKGGAWLIEQDQLNPEKLADLLQSIMDNPQILSDKSIKARQCAFKNTAQNLARWIDAHFIRPPQSY